jgi:hypothetical protein
MLVWLLTISSNQIGQAGRSAQLMNRNELHVAVPFFFFVHLEIDPHHVKSTGTEIRKRGSARHFIVWFIGSDLSPKSKITKNTKTGQRWTVLSIMWRIKMHLIIPCMYFIYRPRFTHFVWYSSRPLIVTYIRLCYIYSECQMKVTYSPPTHVSAEFVPLYSYHYKPNERNFLLNSGISMMSTARRQVSEATIPFNSQERHIYNRSWYFYWNICTHFCHAKY